MNRSFANKFIEIIDLSKKMFYLVGKSHDTIERHRPCITNDNFIYSIDNHAVGDTSVASATYQ